MITIKPKDRDHIPGSVVDSYVVVGSDLEAVGAGCDEASDCSRGSAAPVGARLRGPL